DGTVNGVRPDLAPDRYIQAVLGSNPQVIFPLGSRPGVTASVPLQAGRLIAFYLVQGATTQTAQSQNPTGDMALRPHTWVSYRAGNRDTATDHMHKAYASDGKSWLEIEDADYANDGKGAGDYTDLVATINALLQGGAAGSGGGNAPSSAEK